MPEPALAVGEWVCRCGWLRWGPIRASISASVLVRCPYCHDSAEVMALPVDTT